MLYIRIAVLALAAAFVSVAATSTSTDSSVTRSTFGAPAGLVASGAATAPKDSKLSTELVRLADAAARGQAAGAAPVELPQGPLATGRMRLTDAGEVQVYIFADDTSAATRDALEARGARIERHDEKTGIVQAQVLPEDLAAVAALASVERVRLPDYAYTNAGSVLTEGDAVIKADLARALGLDGRGVTIGVISDGVEGLATSQGLGDLPAVDTATCNMVPEDPTSSGAGAEGTALLEIVHDVAPAATLMFGHFGFGFSGTGLDFNDAVNCLAANADIVVDDIAFFGAGPYDGTSYISANTAAALNGAGPIRGYYTSIGNQSRNHYQESYVDSGFDIIDGLDAWDAHEFDATAGAKGTKHAGNVAAPSAYNNFVLAPGGVADIFMTWDDTWGASGNDYDLIGGDGVDIVVCSADRQDGDDDPIEVCSVSNPTGSSFTIELYFGNYLGAAAAVTFDVFVLCSGCPAFGNGNTLDFNTPGSSVPIQGDAGGSPASVVGVGAVRYSTPGTIEPFSSLGLTNDGRLKPDIVAPDGVCVSGSGGFKAFNPVCQTTGIQFFGTSASAPHAAGVAALLLHCNPKLDRSGLRDGLLTSAVDLGDPGADNVYGFGRLDAQAAATTVGCQDTDQDGCWDAREDLDKANAAIGGGRNPNDFWDYGDMPDPNANPERDGVIRIPDIVRVVERFGMDENETIDRFTDPLSTPPKTGYHPAYDRGGQTGANLWNQAPANGTIRIPDIVNVVQQFGHDCI